jgi:glycosyltransferase involved in cell wall biosynthesis
MNEELVSIITPVFNREKLIGRTIESIISQTFQNWEHVIVDDGSTDDTINIIRQYSNIDSRIKLLSRENVEKGANACRNIGIDNAKGKYIIFLDSDDILLPFCLERRVAFAESNPYYDCFIFSGIRKDLSANTNVGYIVSSYCYYNLGEDLLLLFLTFDAPWHTTAPLYVRERLCAGNLYFDLGIQIHQDILFHIKVVNLGLKILFSKLEPDYIWVEHDSGNISSHRSFTDINVLYSEILYSRILQSILLLSYQKYIFRQILFSLREFVVYSSEKMKVKRTVIKDAITLDFTVIQKYTLKITMNLILFLPGCFIKRCISKLILLGYKSKRKYFLTMTLADYCKLEKHA